MLGHYKRTLRRRAKTYNREMPFPDHLLPLCDGKDTVSILDVGSGPFTTIGTFHPYKKILLTLCDNQSSEYEKICNEGNVQQRVVVECQDMENLKYPDNSFDIVHCRNAVDHTLNPSIAIREMLRVTCDYVFLQHLVNQGERHGYKKGHHWSVELLDDGECLIWNRKEVFHLSSIHHHVSHMMGHHIVSILRKERTDA